MHDNTTQIYQYKDTNSEKEEMRQKGEKGGESWYTAWYEFESDKKDTEEKEKV